MKVEIAVREKCASRHVAELIRDLAAADAPGCDEVTLDLRPIRFYEPLALCVILATVSRWRNREGKRVEILHYSNLDVSYYLERMDFYKHLGIEINSGRARHDPRNNFVPVIVIGPQSREAEIGCAISSCLVKDMPESQAEDTRRLLQYLIGEIVRNCIQHSKGTGYLIAQYFPDEGMFMFGLADDGVGITGSYRLQESPRYTLGDSDVKMLGEALTVQSSSTTHRWKSPHDESANFGVGLPMCRALTQDALGHFNIYSGDAYVFDDFGKADAVESKPKLLKASYGGVAVGLGFTRSAVGQESFYQILREIRVRLGLQKAELPRDYEDGFIE
jgi:hypothetical protein